MRVAGWVAAVSLTLALLPVAAWAEVARTTVGSLSASSEIVVIGTVERVVEVPLDVTLFAAGDKPTRTLHLARVTVDERILGGPAASHVWYIADATWTCDVSAAVPGERVLLFLQRAYALEREGEGPPRAAIRKVTEGAPLYQITGSGRGRMPLRDVAGATYVDVFQRSVRLPADVEVLPPDVFAYRAVRGWARLDELRRLLPNRAPSAEARGAEAAVGLGVLLHQVEATELPGGPDASMAAWDAITDRRDEFVPLLRTLLLDSAASSRAAAAHVLRVEGAAPWLDSANVLERRAAAWAMQSLATEEGANLTLVAGKLAVQVATDPDPEVRWRLLRALMPSGGDDLRGVDRTVARARVIAALSETSAVVARQAAEAIAATSPWTWEDPEVAADRKRALAALGALASSADLRTQRAAWAAIAALRGDAGQALLAARPGALATLDVVARRFLVASLGTVPGANAAARLEGLIAHEDPWVRSAAAHGLALRQDAAAVAILSRVLLDGDASVAESALRELDLLEAPALRTAAIPGLEAALARTTDVSRRATLLRVLADLRR